MSTTSTATEDRALTLLGQGIEPKMVASALGVSVSRIAQLLSDESFAQKVAEARFSSISKHTERDLRADKIEDMLLDRLENIIPMLYDPMKIVHAYSKINAAKRRTSGTPETVTQQQQVLSLTLPTMIIQHFTTNINNQVIKAGSQDLVTIQSGQMDRLVSSTLSPSPPLLENHHEHEPSIST